MNGYFLGVDVGATKTHALLAEASGRAVGFGEAGPGNPFHVGHDGLLRAITSRNGAGAPERECLGHEDPGRRLGIAGYNWPSEHPALSRTVQALGLSVPVTDRQRCDHRSARRRPGGLGDRSRRGDPLQLPRLGSRAERRGVSSASGWAKRRRQDARRAGNLRRRPAIHRRGPDTSLTAAFVAAAGAGGLDDLLEGLTSGRYALTASAAPIVFAEAGRGDPVAVELDPVGGS